MVIDWEGKLELELDRKASLAAPELRRDCALFVFAGQSSKVGEVLLLLLLLLLIPLTALGGVERGGGKGGRYVFPIYRSSASAGTLLYFPPTRNQTPCRRLAKFRENMLRQMPTHREGSSEVSTEILRTVLCMYFCSFTRDKR